MKEANDLPKFTSQDDAIKQARGDFHKLMKEYKTMKLKNRPSNLKQGSEDEAENYNVHSNALNNILYFKDQAKTRKGNIVDAN
jgi:hypothetical protein